MGAAQNLEDVAFYDIDAEDCGECGRKLSILGHYNAYLCCTKCRYSFCCSKAMSVHVGLFHGPQKPVFDIGAPINLDKEMFCCCGFVTKSGNKMAKHLAGNNCKTAYPDEDTAVMAAIHVDSTESAETSADEAMAKAYHGGASKTKTDKKASSAAAAAAAKAGKKSGELAFLGLQRNKDSQEEGENDGDGKGKAADEKKKEEGSKGEVDKADDKDETKELTKVATESAADKKKENEEEKEDASKEDADESESGTKDAEGGAKQTSDKEDSEEG